MAEAKVGVIIEAEDRASSVLSGVNDRVSNLQDKVKSMQPTFTKMAAIGTAAFAGISAGVYKSIEAAGEAAKVQAQLGAVLKSTGGVAGVTREQVLSLSAALQKQTTYGDEAITSAQNMLLTFTNIKSDVFPDAIKTVLDMSTALGQDLKSSSIQLGKALNDPILGVTALRKVGVNFTEQQQEMIKKMVESGKTMDAQKFILKELATEFGGSASAQAETFAGKITQMKERIGDLQEGIGNALLPIINQLIEKLAPVIEKVIAWIEANPELTKNILLVSGALAGLVAIAGTIGLLIPSIIAGVTALGSAFAFFTATPLGAVIAALTGLAVLISKIIDRFYELKTISADASVSAQRAAETNKKLEEKIATTTDPEKKARYQSALAMGQESQQTLENIAKAGFFKKMAVGLGIGSYASGGIVPGYLGQPQLAVVHGGERVLTADENRGNSGAVYNFTFNGDITDKNEFARKIKEVMSQTLSIKTAMP